MFENNDLQLQLISLTKLQEKFSADAQHTVVSIDRLFETDWLKSFERIVGFISRVTRRVARNLQLRSKFHKQALFIF